MKKLLVLIFFFVSVGLFAQDNSKGEKLETIYFRNPQYVLSMDKVIYPGYELKFENIVLHEYLKNKKISVTPLTMPPRLIEFKEAGGTTWKYMKKLKSFSTSHGLTSPPLKTALALSMARYIAQKLHRN